MNRILRVGASVVVALLLLGGLVSVRASWLSALGLDLWTVEEALERIQVQRLRSERLAVQARDVLGRCRSKVTITQDLVEGKLTVPQALVRMRAVCDAEPASWIWLRRVEPGHTDHERLCAHLLGWIRSVHQEDPAQSGTSLARLKKELRRQAKQQPSIGS